MFADDINLWATSSSIPAASAAITSVLNNTIIPWLKKNNMTLSTSKCYSFLFSTHHHDPWPNIYLNGTRLSAPKNPKQIRILGVFFDRQLTFNAHLKIILGRCSTRLKLLARMATCIWGASQADLRMAYFSHIRRVLWPRLVSPPFAFSNRKTGKSPTCSCPPYPWSQTMLAQF
jgi:hypothetical protein